MFMLLELPTMRNSPSRRDQSSVVIMTSFVTGERGPVGRHRPETQDDRLKHELSR